jgi:hypothetical protein
MVGIIECGLNGERLHAIVSEIRENSFLDGNYTTTIEFA